MSSQNFPFSPASHVLDATSPLNCLPTPTQERAQQLLEIEAAGSKGRGKDSNMVAASQKGDTFQ